MALARHSTSCCSTSGTSDKDAEAYASFLRMWHVKLTVGHSTASMQ